MSGSYAVSFWLNVTDRSGTNPRIFTSRAGNDIVVNNDSSRSVGYYYSGNTTATADPQTPRDALLPPPSSPLLPLHHSHNIITPIGAA